MFGYIRPLQEELKVRELARFKSAYCGLCHGLKRRYGIKGRFLLSYDLTFLAMLLYQEKTLPACTRKRCAASPFRRKCVAVQSDSFDLAADYNIILTYWSLRDNLTDSGFWKKIAYGTLTALYGRAYKKAARRRPGFAEKTEKNLQELAELERAKNPSLDRAADKFANILAGAAEERENPLERQALEQILYHTGRYIYLLDAYDDLAEDMRAGRYNPLAYRFSLKNDRLAETDKTQLQTTVTHSLNLIYSAYQLLPPSPWSGILENILYLGMPAARDRVFAGTWQKKEKRLETQYE